jgi:hypothetical protein
VSRGHVVSIRLSDEEHEHLEQLVGVHRMDKSTLLRQLILSAPMWSVQMLPSGPTTTATELSDDEGIALATFLKAIQQGKLRLSVVDDG